MSDFPDADGEPDGPLPDAPTTVDPEKEALARKYGWKPKEDFTLAPAGWVDPERFLESPRTQNKILKDELKKTQERVQLAEDMATQAANRIRAQERAAYQRELDNIRAEKREAVETADKDKYAAAEEREARLAPPVQALPELDQYKATDDGAWLKDPILLKFAGDAVSTSREALAMAPVEQAKWARKQAERYYPHMFTKPQPRTEGGQFSKVDGGGLGGQGQANYGLGDEEMAAARKYVAKGTFKSIKEYAEYSKKIYGEA